LKLKWLQKYSANKVREFKDNTLKGKFDEKVEYTLNLEYNNFKFGGKYT